MHFSCEECQRVLAQQEEQKHLLSLHLEVQQLVCVQRWSDLQKYLVFIHIHALSFLYGIRDVLHEKRP